MTWSGDKECKLSKRRGSTSEDWLREVISGAETEAAGSAEKEQ